jgi:histidine triad (HIT) family protein
MAKRLKNSLNLQAINILNNSGALAGQSVGHFHIHLIPRYPDDHLIIRFPENKMTEEEFRKLAAVISATEK